MFGLPLPSLARRFYISSFSSLPPSLSLPFLLPFRAEQTNIVVTPFGVLESNVSSAPDGLSDWVGGAAWCTDGRM